MALSDEIANWLSQKYPRPRIDPEWAEQCYSWLVIEEHLSPETQLEKIKDEMHTQIILSDLKDSMLPGTGLTTQCVSSEFSAVLDGPPVWVQIINLTDIGVSAFHLNQTRSAREDRLNAGAIEDADDGDPEIDGEGPVPKYQRGMLKFSLSDGALTLNAIEYKPLPMFRLGETKLGTKLILKRPLIRRGIAFLDPQSIEIVGGFTEEIEEQQSFIFKRDLFRRLGLPGAETEPRAPLASIDTPPAPPPPPHAIATQVSTEDRPSERPARKAPVSQKTTTSPYFSTASDPATALDLNLSPHGRDLSSQYPPDPVRRATTMQQRREMDDDEYSLGDEFNFDAEALEELNRAEEAAIASSGTVSNAAFNAVIDIDDEDMDKENEPLPRPTKRRLAPSSPISISDSD